MKHLLSSIFVLTEVLAVLSGGNLAARAAEQTVVLKVDMWCASCPYIIKRSLMDVSGVSEVTTSYEEQTAVVRFDDELATVSDLTRTTADLGFPATVLSPNKH